MKQLPCNSVCEACLCHGNTLECLQARKQSIPEEQRFLFLASFFKNLGDSTRCKILFVLSQKELCVGNIAYLIGMTKSAVSHQLKKLKDAKVLKSRKEGKEVYYSLDDAHVQQMFALTFAHIAHQEEDHHENR